MKKLKCKFCNDEFDVFGNLYFHSRSAHGSNYWKQIVPKLAELNTKLRSYEYIAYAGMKGYHNDSQAN